MFNLANVSASINFKKLIVLGLLLAIVFIFWNSIILYPFRLLVVLIHECGHAIATIATGGRVLEIRINPNEGGVAITQGGIRWIVLSAGYLGSAIFGVLILYLSLFRNVRRYILKGLGVIILLVILFYVRDLFTLGYSLVTALVLIFIGIKSNATLELYLLQFLGITSSLYALFDIRSDLLHLSPNPMSDASQLAQITFIPALIWGILWAILSVFLIYKVLIVIATRQ